MEPSELLRRFVEVLDRLGTRYLVAGSMATTIYGEPRFTNDIDVVVDPRSEQDVLRRVEDPRSSPLSYACAFLSKPTKFTSLPLERAFSTLTVERLPCPAVLISCISPD